MRKQIDALLDRFAMYQFVLYSLLILAAISILFGFLHIVAFSAPMMVLSLITIVGICYGTNYLFSSMLRIPANTESSLITGLILFFVLSPVTNVKGLPIFLLTGVIAMASKYLFAIHKRHLFNPAAIALVMIGIMGSGESIWWIGTPSLLPFVALLGFAVVWKIRRFPMVLTYILTAILTILASALVNNTAITLNSFAEILISWPIIFFATVMFTEPLTTPPTKKTQLIYAVITGILFGIQFQVGRIFSTPELALVLGNVYSYIVSPKQSLRLTLMAQNKLTPEIYEFVFEPGKHIPFRAGQYMEWTLPHANPDSRGIRRYFTIASSPTENEIRVCVRIDPARSSSYKKALLAMKKGDDIGPSHIAGDFTLPDDVSKKCVWIAGGIGITPFRSMVRYMADKKEKRDIVLFYCASTSDGFAYKNILDEAALQVGLKNIYIVTKADSVGPEWNGEKGHITSEMLAKYIPDISERIYYISGPGPMVNAYRDLLKNAGVPMSQIRADYFPGFK